MLPNFHPIISRLYLYRASCLSDLHYLGHHVTHQLFLLLAHVQSSFDPRRLPSLL